MVFTDEAVDDKAQTGSTNYSPDKQVDRYACVFDILGFCLPMFAYSGFFLLLL